MKMTTSLLFPVALAALLGAGGGARAEMIHWTYNWEPGSRVATPGGLGTGGVFFTDERPAAAVGSQTMVATWMGAYSSAPPTRPDVFINRPYTLTLLIQDDQSHVSGSVTFHGLLNGTLTATSAHLRDTYTGPTDRTLHLGHHLYRVTLDPPPTPGLVGMVPVLAHVKVTHNPEPSALVLGALGMGFPALAAGLRCRRRARSSRPPAPEAVG